MTDFVWRPSEELVARANLTRLQRRLATQDYKELHRISVEEPDRFWPERFRGRLEHCEPVQMRALPDGLALGWRSSSVHLAAVTVTVFPSNVACWIRCQG